MKYFFTDTSLFSRISVALLIIGTYCFPAQAQDSLPALSTAGYANQRIGYPARALYNPKYIADEIGKVYENFVVYLNDEQNKRPLSICPDTTDYRGESNQTTGFLIEKGKNTVDMSLLVSLVVSSANTLVVVEYACVTLTSGREQLKNYAVITKLGFEAKSPHKAAPQLPASTNITR